MPIPWFRAPRARAFTAPRRRDVCAAIVLLAVLASGCATQQYAKLREVPKNPLAAELDLLSRSGPKPSPRTMQLLRRYDLVEQLDGDPCKLLEKFYEYAAVEPTGENFYAIAELAYLGGKKKEASDQKVALDLYGASVMHAFLFLFDPHFADTRNPYDPEYRGACDLYNTALEGSLRIVRQQGKLVPGQTTTIETASRKCDVTVVVRGQGWRADDFERFEFASDYEVTGLTNHYHGHGLGVPLVAVRKPHVDGGPVERYYPPKLSLPVTAFLRIVDAGPASMQTVSLPGGGAGASVVRTALMSRGAGGKPAGENMRAVLELYDPLTTPDIPIAGRLVPLESDLTTPLAHFLGQPGLDAAYLSTFGFLMPDEAQRLGGIYMLQPYQPGKIPVIMVHGLWSTPFTWVEMFNDLRGDPRLQENYQFWFYLYPTGKPFWFLSAAQFREELAQLRTTLDPQHQQPALDQMVLVGHSMGGLISKLQSIDSGDQFWRIVSNRQLSEIKVEPETKAVLEKTFFFRANPSIKQVVTIGTPHRGSDFANDITRYLSHKLITMPMVFTNKRDKLVSDNPEFIQGTKLLAIETSIDSLAPSSPFLPVLLAAPTPPWVKYHNVVGLVESDNILRRISGTSDGVVKVDSAKVENAATQLVVTADHSGVHRHPLAIRQVRKILLAQLEELKAQGYQPGVPWTTAAGEQPVRR